MNASIVSALAPAVPLVAAASVGVVAWTLAEYLLHRFLGHDKRTSRAGWNFFVGEHTRHHSEGGYFAPTWKKALLTAIVVPVAAAAFVVAGAAAAAFFVGFIGMYAVYEWVHRRAHTHRGLGRYGAYLRRHHFHHHFRDPRSNHGVTTPIWDFVFRTRQTPSRIRVPKKLQMQWLVDPATGDVWADLASSYELL